MITPSSDIKISKFLSLILRHKPDAIDLALDDNGWADIDELIQKANLHGPKLSREDIERVVANNDKQRFALSPDKTRIRANQGHSLEINLELPHQQPPEILYHGTADRFLSSIKARGLLPLKRQYVHLSLDEATAYNVGRRHGRAIVLSILSGAMWREGIPFYLSDNGVWLVETVPPEFIEYK